MVTAIAPFAIFLGVATTAGLIFYTFWERVANRAAINVRGLSTRLDRAGMRVRAEEVVLAMAGGAAALWIAVTFTLRPGLLLGLLLLPVSGALAFMTFHYVVQFKLRKRFDAFISQLELALRLTASGIRVGLGLRQALHMVIDEMPDPARHEYMRVIGRTNLGASVYDALDDLAARMPSGETLMMARAIRIQSQTGGDLCKILEHLADTIRDRRRIARKISALTAEGRASTFILCALPIFLAAFICLTQPAMGHALLFTNVGHVALAIVAVLEACGIFFLLRILAMDL